MTIIPLTTNWNLMKELVWVESIIEGRLALSGILSRGNDDDGQGVDFFLDPERIEPEKLVQVHSMQFRSGSKGGGLVVFTYNDPDRALSDEAFLMNRPVQFIKADGEWVLVRGTGGKIEEQGGRAAILMEKTFQAWLPRHITDLPSFYHNDITTEEFEAALPGMDDYWFKKLAPAVLSREKRKTVHQIQRRGFVGAGAPPRLVPDQGPVFGFIYENDLQFRERLLLGLALMVHVKPAYLHELFMNGADRVDKRLGGVKGSLSGVFVPTGQTFLFLAAGDDVLERLQTYQWLCHGNILIEGGVIRINPSDEGDIFLGNALILSEYYLQLLLTSASSLVRPDKQTSDALI